jgi:hypothetical protein
MTGYFLTLSGFFLRRRAVRRKKPRERQAERQDSACCELHDFFLSGRPIANRSGAPGGVRSVFRSMASTAPPRRKPTSANDYRKRQQARCQRDESTVSRWLEVLQGEEIVWYWVRNRPLHTHLSPPVVRWGHWRSGGRPMIRKLSSGEYRLYSRKKDPKTGKRRNLGTFKTRAAAEKHERAVQYFKRHG